jgi:hypothetical protein
LDRRARRLGEARFGEQLASALAERDTRLIEMETHATKRYHLLEQATSAARRFEIETQEVRAELDIERAARRDLQRNLEQSTAQAQELEALCADLRERNRRNLSGGSSVDIFREGDPLVLNGAGWYIVEEGPKGPFRWVSSEAEFSVAQLTRSPYTLAVEIEPGPAVGSKPFDIGVFEGDTRIATLGVPGRKIVDLDLLAGPPRVRRLTLRVENAGPPSPTPGDTRTLSYRMFKMELTRKAADILHAGSGAKVGTGWHPLETFKGETFRWAGPEAIIDLEKGDLPVRVALDVEPGPGVGLKPFKIKTFLNDKALGEIDVQKRQRIELTCPAGAAGKLLLKVEGGGKSAPNDPRIMNFRAFSAAE